MKEKTFLDRIISNPFIQTLVIFISGGWIILEITEYLITNFGLNESSRNIILIVLLSIFPVVILLVWYYLRKQKSAEEYKSGKIEKVTHDKTDSKHRRFLLALQRPKIIVPGILIMVAIILSVVTSIRHHNKVHEALDITLPLLVDKYEQVEETSGTGNWEIYYVAVKLQKVLRREPIFIKFWDDITDLFAIQTIPEGAKVYGKPYSKPDTSWYFLGETPLMENYLPKGLTRLKIEKPGYITQFDMVANHFRFEYEGDTVCYTLYRENEIPDKMVHVPGFKGEYWRTQFLPHQDVGKFLIDKYEVTNSQFKVFVDSGGYNDPDYWTEPFIDGVDTLRFAEAVNRFKDQTGWYGPANWEMGEFPEGEDDLPVSGVSWFEANAYARFANKELPTIFHWLKLAELQFSPEIVKYGNFDKKGPARGGTYRSLTRYGTYDLPGNVSEWIFNSSGDDRLIIGGNYKEPTYWYNLKLPVTPWARSELVGFRCMRYINDTLKDQLTRNFQQPQRNYSNLNPVSDEIFQVYRELCQFNRGAVNPKVVSRNQFDDYILEVISVNVPYENDPMLIKIWLPLDSKPPYQPVIYFPGISAQYSHTVNDIKIGGKDYFLKSGRALIYPDYYSSFGRGDHDFSNVNSWKQTYKCIITDFRVVCDYIQTRSDIDRDKISYYGNSWGGGVAPYILAVEDRVKVGIVSLFGVASIEKYMFKEFDQVDYLPRVKIPMLLLGGKYDPDYYLEQQEAFYNLLGTEEKDKKWIIYESTHFIPRKDLINESISWLDKYLGTPDKIDD